MSVWSGLAAGGIGLVLIFLAVGTPIWECRIDTPGAVDMWSYRSFSAHQEVSNKTTSRTDVRNYSYAELASTQGSLSKVFSKYQLYLFLGILATVAGMGLSAVTRWKKIPGIFAGVAFAGASAAILYATLDILFAIPTAAGTDISTQITTLGGRMSDNSLVWGPAMGLFFPIGSGLAFAWASSDLWHLRPGRGKLPMRVKTVSPPVPQTSSVEVPPPPVEPAPILRPEPVVEEVFVIGSNGLLIKHMARTLMTDKDRDVVGSMISAISSFVREAFSERDGEVQEVSLGDHRFIMCNERGVVVAVLVTAGETDEIVPRLRHLLTVLIDRYGSRLGNWQGEALEGIEDELHVLWDPYRLPPPPAE
jgi:predicted regulator of Ras-like GTPase activity (Roadblock/LC7/MglB family)